MFGKVNVKDAMKWGGDIKDSTCSEVMSVAAVKHETIINDFLTHECHHLYNQHKDTPKRKKKINHGSLYIYGM